jgi:ribosome maturation factor RimP
MSVVDRVRPLVTPIVSDLGLELYDLEHAGGVLRVVIERDGGVDLDTISLVTRLVSRELDHSDPIPGRYTLEVSSPGLERVLRTPDHFRRVIGRTVAVRTHAGVAGDRRVHGVLRSVDDDGIVVLLDEPASALVERQVAFEDIERARTVFVWAAAPKPGKGPRRPAAAARQVGPVGPAVAGEREEPDDELDDDELDDDELDDDELDDDELDDDELDDDESDEEEEE